MSYFELEELYILNAIALSDIYLQIFSVSLWLAFLFFSFESFREQKAFNFDEAHFINRYLSDAA